MMGMRTTPPDPSAADLAATVRAQLRHLGPFRGAAGEEALDALVARCEQLERERDALQQEKTLTRPGYAQWSMVGADVVARAEAAERRVAELEAALTEAKAIQPRTVDRLREKGIVFDQQPQRDHHPTNWQQTAFWIYTDLCEVDSIARAALEGGEG